MKKILLVEDDKALCLLYKEELAKEGYKVTAVQSAQAGLDALGGESFDLIITDIRMPEVDGLDFIGQVLSRHRDIPIVINTAYQSYKADFMAWAADAYIVKSSSLSELKTKIKELLANPHVATEKRSH